MDVGNMLAAGKSKIKDKRHNDDFNMRTCTGEGKTD